MSKKKITVQGLKIRILKKEIGDYICLTDIARKFSNSPKDTVKAYMRNSQNIGYFSEWEKLCNPDFKEVVADHFKIKSIENAFVLSVKKWIKETNAIGFHSILGRYGGTYAHADIALQFAMWLNPIFHLYIVKEFQRLKQEEFNHQNLEWHISKITDNIDVVRNLLDTIPGQDPKKNRIASKGNKS